MQRDIGENGTKARLPLQATQEQTFYLSPIRTVEMTQLATTSDYTQDLHMTIPITELGRRSTENGRVDKTAGQISESADLRPESKRDSTERTTLP